MWTERYRYGRIEQLHLQVFNGHEILENSLGQRGQRVPSKFAGCRGGAASEQVPDVSYKTGRLLVMHKTRSVHQNACMRRWWLIALPTQRGGRRRSPRVCSSKGINGADVRVLQSQMTACVSFLNVAFDRETLAVCSSTDVSSLDGGSTSGVKMQHSIPEPLLIPHTGLLEQTAPKPGQRSPKPQIYAF